MENIWAYGITTCSLRVRNGLFQQTLNSLEKSGFDRPHLFINGASEEAKNNYWHLNITERFPKTTPWANWYLALLELYLRNSKANRFAIFQDDLVMSLNVKEYLDSVTFPDNGYWNLYTFPENQKLFSLKEMGFKASNQRGLGALALVFDRSGVKLLLSSSELVNKSEQTNFRGVKSIDGGVVNAFSVKQGKEYCHNPSLVQHTGIESSIGNKKHPIASSFRGEDFNSLSLLTKKEI